MKNLHRSLVIGCSALALAGCGADQILSPGTSGPIDVDIINGGGTPTPTPTPTQTLVTPANGCPTINSTGGLTDDGTITGTTGTYRVCVLPSLMDADDTLPYISGLLYALNGRVDIGCDGGPTVPTAGTPYTTSTPGCAANLTSDTGVDVTFGEGAMIFAGTATQSNGRSFIVANRGNRLNATGTDDRPVVFTSRDNVLGIANESSIGQWGGVVLLGRAAVSDCVTGGVNQTPQSSCQMQLEGTNTTTLFGGNTPADNSGTLSHVQIRYSGFSIAPGNELQSLTTGGIGSNTTLEYIQSVNSSDDGAEFFGGNVNLKYIVVDGADDDSLDVDSGAQANVQYALVKQRTNGGDSLIELDTPNAEKVATALPRTVLKVANFTFIQAASASSQVVRVRGGGRLDLVNGVIDVDGDKTCIRIDELLSDTAPTFNFIKADCGTTRPFRGPSSADDATIATAWNTPSGSGATATGNGNDAAFAVGFTNGFTNNAALQAVVSTFDPAVKSSFFDTTTYVGAVEDGTDNWYDNWTCNTSRLAFGSTNGSCTSLPVY